MQAKLETFRKKVESERHVNYWTTAPELAGAVALSFLSDFPEVYPADGWLRGDVQTSAESLVELNQLRKTVAAWKSNGSRRVESRQRKPRDCLEARTSAAVQPFYRSRVTLEVPSEYVPGSVRPDYRTLQGEIAPTMSWNRYFSVVGPLLT